MGPMFEHTAAPEQSTLSPGRWRWRVAMKKLFLSRSQSYNYQEDCKNTKDVAKRCKSAIQEKETGGGYKLQKLIVVKHSQFRLDKETVFEVTTKKILYISLF